MRAGVIIAGGRSTRFGNRDKALAELAGTPMIRRVADRISGVVDQLIVNCRNAQIDDIETALADIENQLIFAPDDRPDEGPVAGIATGLATVESEYAFVVACDMPSVDPDFVEYLFDRASGHDAAVPHFEDWFQTMHAVYRVKPMVTACERVLDNGGGRTVEPLFDLDYVVVQRETIETHTTVETFKNLNTRAEFEVFEERFD